MIRVLNIIIIILLTIFFYKVFSFYSSLNNKDLISKNRENIDNIIDSKIQDIPFFKNDTNNVIEFNSGYNQMMMKIIKDFGIYLKMKKKAIIIGIKGLQLNRIEKKFYQKSDLGELYCSRGTLEILFRQKN